MSLPVQSRRVVAIVLIAMLASSGPVPAIAQGVSAPGRPIIDCTGLQSTAARMRAGLPAQDEAIRRTEAQLNAARQGRREAQGDLQTAMLKSATLAAEQTLSVVRDAQSAIRTATGSAANRQKWFERYEALKKSAEAIEKLTSSGAAGASIGTAIREHQLTATSLLKDIEASGISDELGLKAAEFAGPLGVVSVAVSIAARDLIYAGISTYVTGNEVEAAERNLAEMRAARRAIDSKIYEMEGIVASPDCGAKPPNPADRMMVQKEPDPAPASPATQSPAPARAPKKGGGGGGMMLLALAAAGGAGYYAYTKAKTCTPPTTNVLTVCSQSSSSSACKTAIADQDAYCKCEGYASFSTIQGQCVK